MADPIADDRAAARDPESADDRAAGGQAGGNKRVAPDRATALRRFVVWMLIGLAIGGAAGLIGLRQIELDPTPSLTPELFHAAHANWKAHSIQNYDIEIRVTGPQAAVYRAEVRDGGAQAARRNDRPLTTRRTLGTWSVSGMFATISRDVEALERAAAKGAPPPLILRAAFDATYGYPAHYRRIDNGSRKGGDSIAVTWDVTEFRVIEPTAQ